LPTLSGPFDAIVFDVGGVLVAHDNRLIYERLASRCSAGVSASDIERRLVEPRWDVGAAPISDLHAQLRRDLGYAGGWDQFLADWCCHFTFDRSMLAFAHALAKEIRVILFSNTNREHWEYLLADTAAEIGAFERYLSFEMGVAKPAVRAYDMVAESAGIVPSRAIFFDDRMENVAGARRAGFRAELFSGEATLREDLAHSGVPLPSGV